MTFSLDALLILGSLRNDDGNGCEKVTKKGEFAPPQTLSRLFHLVLFVSECWENFFGVEFQRTASKFRKRKRKLFFLCSRPRQNVKVVVAQRRQRNVQKSVMHVQSCCFVNLNLLMLCRSRCRRRRRVNSLVT